ncbi:aminotransferase class IV [Alicyclobacillus sp. ALC3]|uniref:aminotransferase class IV n=1 Tax=Alicyclobacillus sp. ALC3 TaxID=2796143 RepID=UPI0023788E3C|nr:aminotransferase class IV [Alicyclobacillus sp. ALC3]WDL98024.1 aminotransferase class IV [Alicyclobacillus sp. ALC3]
MPAIGYLNGEFQSPDSAVVPIDERGHNFGDGVYEVLRVYGGRAFLSDWHFERLERSLRAIAIDNPHTRAEWARLMNEAIRRSGEAQALVYLQVTRGFATRSHGFPQVRPSVSMTVRKVSEKAPSAHGTLLCLPDERWGNVWVKTINLLPNVIAKEVAHRAGADEALLVRNGEVTEGSSSNAWFVRDGVIWTAPADRYILAGVTRRLVLQLAEELGLTVREQRLPLDDLKDVDEVFITGTTSEVQPIHKVFVDEGTGPALQALPDTAPDTLLQEVSHPVTLWETEGTGVVTAKLREAYADYVTRFAMLEV